MKRLIRRLRLAWKSFLRGRVVDHQQDVMERAARALSELPHIVGITPRTVVVTARPGSVDTYVLDTELTQSDLLVAVEARKVADQLVREVEP